MSKIKTYMFTAFFSIGIVLFLWLPNFPIGKEFMNNFDVFDHILENFIFLMVAVLFISYILTELTVYIYRLAYRFSRNVEKISAH